MRRRAVAGTSDKNSKHASGNGSFGPKLAPRKQRAFEGFDEKTLRATCRSTRKIERHLRGLCCVSVGRNLISP